MTNENVTELATLTRDDLVEALRVNRALRHAAVADRDRVDGRVEMCRKSIARIEAEIIEYTHDAQTAPGRIAKLDAAIERQATALEQMTRGTALTKSMTTRQTNLTSKSDRIKELTARIAAGDQAAIAEMIKLAQTL